MNHLKGEAIKVCFDGGIKLGFHGAKVIPPAPFFGPVPMGFAELSVKRTMANKPCHWQPASSNTIGRFEIDILS